MNRNMLPLNINGINDIPGKTRKAHALYLDNLTVFPQFISTYSVPQRTNSSFGSPISQNHLPW